MFFLRFGLVPRRVCRRSAGHSLSEFLGPLRKSEPCVSRTLPSPRDSMVLMSNPRRPSPYWVEEGAVPVTPLTSRRSASNRGRSDNPQSWFFPSGSSSHAREDILDDEDSELFPQRVLRPLRISQLLKWPSPWPRTLLILSPRPRSSGPKCSAAQDYS